MRRHWVLPTHVLAVPELGLASLGALARQSMLVGPAWPTDALSPSQWKLASRHGAKTVPEPEPGVFQLELWSCSPALVPDTALLDPLSPVPSLQSDADDRVQQALDAIAGRLPW